MRKHDAHVRKYLWRKQLKRRYSDYWFTAAFFFFIFCIFAIVFYFGQSYSFFADDLFNCFK